MLVEEDGVGAFGDDVTEDQDSDKKDEDESEEVSQGRRLPFIGDVGRHRDCAHVSLHPGQKDGPAIRVRFNHVHFGKRADKMNRPRIYHPRGN